MSYLVGDLERLGSLCSLRLLQGGLKLGLHILGKRCSRGDNNSELALVLGHKVVEALNDASGLRQTAIVGKEREQVLGDVRNRLLLGTTGGHKETVKAGLPVLRGEGRVGHERANAGLVLEGGGDGGKFGLDLGQSLRVLADGGIECSLGIFESERGGGTTAKLSRRDGGTGSGEHRRQR
jgi:hypothetical protein